MKNLSYFITLIATIITLKACTSDDEIISSTQQLSAFHSIELNSIFEVILEEDSIFEMSMSGNENELNKIKFEVKDSVLTIENNKKLKWATPQLDPIKIHIKSMPLKLVSANETCKLFTANAITSKEFGLIVGSKANYADLNLTCNVFYYWNSFPCGGKINLSGNTNELKIWNTALMTIDAQQLVTSFALVENKSKGKCIVNVTDKLEYLIDGEGDILVYGSPSETIEKQPSKGGELIHL